MSLDLTRPVPVVDVAPTPAPVACVNESDTYDVAVLFERINVLERALELVLDDKPGRARFAIEATRLRHPEGGRVA